MHKVIIAGTRTFNDYSLMEKEVHKFLSGIKISNTEIVSGGANGADKLGELLAENYNLKLTKFPADWNKYGKSAGYKRNVEMAKYSNLCIVFWDGKSRGSKHMIDIAKMYRLNLKIVKYKEGAN